MQATFMYIDLDKVEIILEKLKCMTSQPEWLLGSIISVRVTLTLSDCYRLSSRIICCLSNDKTMKNSDGLYTGKKSALRRSIEVRQHLAFCLQNT